MFSGCQMVTSLNLSNFNTENVEAMVGMFSNCSRLTALNLSSFNTSKVTMMNKMFEETIRLESLTLSDNFTLKNVENKTNMFTACAALFYCCTVFGVTDSEIKTALRTGTGWDDSRTHIQFALSGTFTVNDNAGTKTVVRFSKGNLWADVTDPDNPVFHFEEKQYDFRTYENFGSCINGDNTGVTPANNRGLFGWSTDGGGAGTGYKKWGINTSGNSDVYKGSFKDWGEAIESQSKWRTLSDAEWKYLFSYDGSSNGGENYDNDYRRGKYKYDVTVCGIDNCVVLLPDEWDTSVISLTDFANRGTYSEISTPKWSEMEVAGAVCLPAAGAYSGGVIDEYFVVNVGSWCRYWTSSDNDNNNAYCVKFSDDPFSTTSDSRSNGYSVRLVRDVPAAE